MFENNEFTFQRMVDSIPIAIITFNQKMEITYFNSFAEKLFMFDKDEILGKSLEKLIPKSHNGFHSLENNTISLKTITEHNKNDRNYIAVKKDGTEFPIEVKLSNLDINGENIILASLIDISEKLKINEEKKKIKNQFELVVEQAPNSIILVNSNGRISFVNKMTESVFGYSKSELIGKDIEILLPERFKSNHKKLVESFSANPQIRQMGKGRELFASRKNGTEFPVEIGLNPIDMEEGKGILLSIIDITERKNVDNLQKLHLSKIESKNKELEQFISFASHDLRAPIQSISSSSQLLIDDPELLKYEDGKSSINFINQAASRMKILLDGLLDYGQLGINSKITKVNFNKVLNEVCDDLNFEIKKSKAKIRYKNLPEIYAYETEIRLLFQNLLANAIKFRKADSNPEIKITAEKNHRFWEFEVIDNGIGISSNDKEKIFIIFQKIHRTKEFDGMGIGLAHCRKIVGLHNGEIGVESKEGNGSTFYFTIDANLN